MHIYLIADTASMQLTERLLVYLKPFFTPAVQFHIRPYEGDSQSYWAWDELFAVGQQEKTKSLLPAGEHYFIFLVHGANEYNWFGAVNPDASTIAFLQTSNWGELNHKDDLYPVAYHLIALITSMKFFGNHIKDDIYHEVSRGCMYDFSEVKEEVSFKMKAANICNSCLSKIAQFSKDRVEAMDFIQRVFLVLRSIRDNISSLDLQQFFGKPEYSLTVDEDANLILHIDHQQVVLPISNGKEKALFFMLLKYESGLSYRDFEKETIMIEFLKIYHKYFVVNGSLNELYKQAQRQLEDGTYRKHLEPLVSRMRKRLKACLSAYPEILQSINIQSRGGALVIPIQRNYLQNKLVRRGLAS
ncbi:hypothetical protein [Mongoliitalea lutea]|uniref:Uncharacterized protein n=1 Tax=Mongoliitalea lutea TaxID=849756 RepID=A0A8J3G6K1_9BACT|nr:hypothetical protein [Mongoliitalea lutea]GHB49148.1 hypothetical protein GCM10008106_32430 [Mongoliitalea lutea]